MGKLWEPGERYYSSRLHNRRKLPYGRNQGYRAGYRTWRKYLWQVAACFAIFLIIWGVFQFDSPVIRPVQAKIRNWFTEDYNIEPVLKFFSDVGLWGDTFDRAAFEASQYPPATEPLTIPVSGQIIKPFGWIVSAGADQVQTFHDGIVIAAPEGTPVKAALAGVVSRIANEETLGRVVDITGANGMVSSYGHCSEILVNLNDKIIAGQVVARVGKTGKAAHAQLYFRIVSKGEPLDPAKLFIPSADKT